MVKIWLDDFRPAPDGWVHVYTPEEVVDLLKAGGVERVSLDHDLGLVGYEGERERTGHDVLLWLEEQVLTGRMKAPDVPLVRIHTANSAARIRMRRARDIIRGCLEAQGRRGWSVGLDEVRP